MSALAQTPHRGAKGKGSSGPGSLDSPALIPALCESCHGPLGSHGSRASGAADAVAPAPFVKKSAEERSAPCLGCHQDARRQHWSGSAHHAGNVSCTDCHRLHPPARPVAGLPARSDEVQTCLSCHLDVRQSLWRSSRHPVREGRMLCSGCHEPHGSLAEAELRRPTVNETCLECHADKRGPFLWTHPPVAENCLNCHVAHGSLHDSLLIQKPPRLCQTCHLEPVHVSDPHSSKRGGAFIPDRFVFNRSCGDCHMVHGSNSSSGSTLVR